MRRRLAITLSLILVAGAVFGSQLPGLLSQDSLNDSSGPDRGSLESNSSFDSGYGSFNTRSGRFDRNADGRLDLIVTDRNGDGMGDYWATDRNFDGIMDDYQYDRNFNGQIDQWEYDYDGDGIPDKIFIDADGDGQSEIYAEWNPMTRAYAWYGKGGRSSFASGIRSKKRLAAGRAAFSE